MVSIKIQTALPGPCMGPGRLMRNYVAANVAHTQKDKPPPLVEEESPFQNT
jgi:hypothetical protein